MMKCPKCKKEVSELDEKCKYCGIDFEKYEQEEAQEEIQEEIAEDNKTFLIKIINTIQVIACIIISIVFFSDENIIEGIIILIISFVIFTFIKGFQNIIELLDNINRKIK